MEDELQLVLFDTQGNIAFGLTDDGPRSEAASDAT